MYTIHVDIRTLEMLLAVVEITWNIKVVLGLLLLLFVIVPDDAICCYVFFSPDLVSLFKHDLC